MRTSPKEFRGRARTSLTGKAKLFWQEEHHQQEALAELHDISRNGLSCWLPHRLPAGLRVKIEIKQPKLNGFGTVRHCRNQGMRFLLGLQFDSNLEWLAPGEAPVKPRWT